MKVELFAPPDLQTVQLVWWQVLGCSQIWPQRLINTPGPNPLTLLPPTISIRIRPGGIIMKTHPVHTTHSRVINQPFIRICEARLTRNL